MKVSIITACFNSSLTILDAIKSVNNQTYKDIEHIFIDGVSNDNTTEIIRLNSKKTKLIISEEDSGLYDAINKGVLNATGDIIALLHSDDIFSSSEIISDLMKKIQNENLDGVYGDLLYVDKINTNKIIRFWKSCEFNSNLLVKGWMPAHPTLILRKEVYIKHGVFNKSFKIAADYDFMLRILKDSNLKFGYLPKVVTKMRVGGASNRSIKNIINKSKEDYRAICSNNIGGIITLLLKNTSKIKQFLIKKS
mgnify:CR=1 FL=1|jgi:glycosyltransferase involved in cell wall biosynthesis